MVSRKIYLNFEILKTTLKLIVWEEAIRGITPGSVSVCVANTSGIYLCAPPVHCQGQLPKSPARAPLTPNALHLQSIFVLIENINLFDGILLSNQRAHQCGFLFSQQYTAKYNPNLYKCLYISLSVAEVLYRRQLDNRVFLILPIEFHLFLS